MKKSSQKKLEELLDQFKAEVRADGLLGKLTTRQAAARIGICISALRRMVYAGKLREIRLSERCILYSEADVDKLIASRQAQRLGRPRKTKPWSGGG